jgi:hypothetical protein
MGSDPGSFFHSKILDLVLFGAIRWTTMEKVSALLGERQASTLPLTRGDRDILMELSNVIGNAIGTNVELAGCTALSVRRALQFDVPAEVYKRAQKSESGRSILLNILEKLVDYREWEGVFAFLTFSRNYDAVDPLGRALNRSGDAQALHGIMGRLPPEIQKRLREFTYECDVGDGKMQARGLFEDGLCSS